MKPAESVRLWQRVASLYAKGLKNDPQALGILKLQGLTAPELLDTFQLGYSNGGLGGVLPQSGEVREQLKAMGLLSVKGEEVLQGYFTVPLRDAEGMAVDFMGFRFRGLAWRSVIFQKTSRAKKVSVNDNVGKL